MTLEDPDITPEEDAVLRRLHDPELRSLYNEYLRIRTAISERVKLLSIPVWVAKEASDR